MSSRALACTIAASLMLGCASSPVEPSKDPVGGTGIRVVNAFVVPVDLMLDGSVVASNIPAGHDSLLPAEAGKHTYSFRPSAGGTTTDVVVKVLEGKHAAMAAVRSSTGALAGAFLEDTNAVVPSGATKVRVLHLAPLAGEVQVWRTQPDYSTPIRWQFPFLYTAEISALGNPYYQSTVGTWDIRLWTDVTVHPAGDSFFWPNPLAQVHFTLRSGEKRTVLILDAPGGGVKLEVIE